MTPPEPSPKQNWRTLLRSRTTQPFGLWVGVILSGGWMLSQAHATDTSRAQALAAELNVPRQAWTICTVKAVGSAISAGQSSGAGASADEALANCLREETALRRKATELLGEVAAERLMKRLIAEAREALIESAKTLEATKASGNTLEPTWPRVLVPPKPETPG